MKEKLIIVTDLGQLKAYRLEFTEQGTPRLALQDEAIFESAHHRLADQVTDNSGRFGAPTQKKWGAPMSDGGNLDLEMRRRLVRQVAERIGSLIQSKAVNGEGCWLAAPREIQSQLLDELPQPVRSRIEKCDSHDLVKTSPANLLQHFGVTP